MCVCVRLAPTGRTNTTDVRRKKSGPVVVVVTGTGTVCGDAARTRTTGLPYVTLLVLRQRSDSFLTSTLPWADGAYKGLDSGRHGSTLNLH